MWQYLVVAKHGVNAWLINTHIRHGYDASSFGGSMDGVIVLESGKNSD
jgi:hypothetical protein